MKELMILFVALFSIGGTTPGNAASQRTVPRKGAENKTKHNGTIAL